MKFRLFKRKPTGREVIESIFSRFTPEETAILDGDDCFIPNMYSLPLQQSPILETRLTMEEMTQFYIFRVFIYCIFTEGEYI